MKKYLPCALLLLSGISAAGTFDGPHLQVGAGFANLTSNLQYYFSPSDIEEDAYSHFGILGKIDLGYSYNFANNLNMAVNVFYHFGTHQAGHYTDPSSTETAEFATLKNIWGVSLEPGYYLDNDTLAYLKLGLASGASTGRFGYNNTNYTFNYGESTGPLYGFGIQHTLYNDFYFGLETYHIDFFNTHAAYNQNFISSNKPHFTYGGLYIGHPF